MNLRLTAVIALLSIGITSGFVAERPVMELDGIDSYIELPPDIFNQLDRSTVELWVKWERLNGEGWKRPFCYGAAGRDLSVGVLNNDSLWFVIGDNKMGLQAVAVPSVLRSNEWCHIAAVSG